MRSHHALPSSFELEPGHSAAVESIVDNVVPLFAPRAGSVTALIAAASGPADPRELAGESEIRAAFRAAVLERPVLPARRRRPRLAPLAIAAGSVAGLVAGTAGLSAAAVLPPAANHVVAQVLRHVGIDVTPAATPAPTATAARTSVSVTRPRTNGHPKTQDAPVTSLPATSLTPALSRSQPKATAVTPTCEVSTITSPSLLGQVRSETATPGALIANHALVLKASPPTPGKGHCTLSPGGNRSGKPSGKGAGGTGPTGGTGPGSGSSGPGGGGTGSGGGGTGSGGGGTTTGRGTNHGTGSGHGHHGHHGHKGGSGTGSGTGTGSGGTAGSSGGSTTGTTTPTTSVPGSSPSTGPATAMYH